MPAELETTRTLAVPKVVNKACHAGLSEGASSSSEGFVYGRVPQLVNWWETLLQLAPGAVHRGRRGLISHQAIILVNDDAHHPSSFKLLKIQ